MVPSPPPPPPSQLTPMPPEPYRNMPASRRCRPDTDPPCDLASPNTIVSRKPAWRIIFVPAARRRFGPDAGLSRCIRIPCLIIICFYFGSIRSASIVGAYGNNMLICWLDWVRGTAIYLRCVDKESCKTAMRGKREDRE